MAQSTITQDGINLVVPGTYVSVQTRSSASAAATAGIVTIVGEADQGPAFIDEADLNDVAFAPSQFNRVAQKYVSGPIVDAFKALVSAANDPAIVGSVTLVRIIKTNPSQAASAVLSSNGAAYANLSAKLQGVAGNLIKYRSEVATPESAPDSGSMAYAPDFNAAHAMSIVVNGSATKSVAIASKMELSALAAAIEDIGLGILAAGSAEVVPTASNVGQTLTASNPDASTLVVSLPVGQLFSGSPAVGDAVIIPESGDFGASADSIISNSGASNIGAYIISAVSNTAANASLTLKLVNAPSGMSLSAQSGSIVSGARDLILYKPMAIKNYTGSDRHAADGMTGSFVSVVSGPNVTLTAPAAWSVQPKAGDIFKLSSAFAGIASGFYLVSSASANNIVMVRQSLGSAGSSSSQAVASPIDESNAPFIVLKPSIDGHGKSLELSGDAGAVLRDPATRAASARMNSMIASAAELRNTTTISRGTVIETFTAGGEIVIRAGSSLPAASLEVFADRIELSASAALVASIPFNQFTTIQNVVDYINSQTGFSASIVSAKYSALSPAVLDKGVYGLVSAVGALPARIKKDASAWSQLINGSTLVSAALQADAGLPEASTPDKFLAGGSKGATSGASIVAGIDACEKLETNFIIPLFSQDASADIALGLTDSASTYTIDAINAYAKAHVLKMSQVKMRKNRIAMVSKLASYNDVKEAAGELVSYRVGLSFQKVRAVSAAGQIVEYQPWMTAVIATGMQAAAGYKGIVKKFANVSGVIAQADFDASNPGDLEDALQSGLLILERVNTGGFRWVSDQTTYSVDNNFVYNSLQAVYLADLMVYSLISTFDRQLVGKSVAEISAQAAMSILEAAMFNFLRLKWIAPSDDNAPKGFKNASVQINGGVCTIAVEAKLAGILYFAPIALTLSEVQQSASSA